MAIIVFDVSNSQSLRCVTNWASMVRNQEVITVLVGNKADLIRNVSREQAEAKAKEIGAGFYYETSAIDNKSVQGLFQEIGVWLYKKQNESHEL